jgi:adenine-specific DNA-methyltransferase
MTPTTLGHSLEIYIPSQCRCGKPLPEQVRAEILDEVKATMAGWFGGNSAKKVDPRVERIEGSWMLGDGTLAKEPVDVVQSFTDEGTVSDHRDEFTAYVAQLANRLTQEQMLCRIDGKSVLYPSAPDPKPHRCAGGVTSATIPKPREAGEKQRMLALQASLQRLGGTNDVRDLFCNILHYEYETGIVPTTTWPDSVKQCLAPGVPPQIVANQNGFQIIYVQLADGSLRKSHERQLVQRLIKDNPGLRGLVVVSDVNQKQWNLVNVKFDREGNNRDRLLLRRMRVGPGQPVRTAVERLFQVDVEILGEDATAADLQDIHDKAFDVEAVTKQFFNDVANWYFWALKNAQFPKDAPKEDDGHDHVSLIRLITRLIFCWFLREKGLLPDTLFDRRQLNDILTGFAPDKVGNKDSVYYRAILQNLFFATLSTETDNRKWATDEKNFMAHSLYRFKECFQKPATALNLFKSIPFLNGGLFECLDKDLGESENPRYIRIDGFSRRSDSQPVVPDFLFFGPEKEIDLSEEYGDRRFRNVRVRGLINTLRHYNFTIEENTPVEEEVALDPELCGKVFENLLAAYNPETGTTARKQSGSFYTPREIVNYMVDEALIAYLSTKLEAAIPTAKDIGLRLRHLLAYNDEPNQFDKNETTALIAAIDTLKSLDPAVGSGAFPMGLLHKLVFILGKLDPRNEQWKERQIARVREAIAVADKIEDETIRSRTVEELEQQVVNVNEAFDRNELDYGRKLYLIENCIYGVDIQPIAVQIAKMRFFISLIVDQKIDDSLPNRGIRPLPNLETKFVAANSLIGINRPGQQLLRNIEIDIKEAELRRVREKHFMARTPKQKAKCRDEDAKLRAAIAELLKGDGWDTITARNLASWNPYDQNASAEFFDSEWMFGIKDGFDICEGNPPYGVVLSAHELKYLLLIHSAAKKVPDSYCFFILRAMHLLNEGGHLSFIVPNTFCDLENGDVFRKHLLESYRLLQIWQTGWAFEAAVVDTLVLFVQKTKSDLKSHLSIAVNGETYTRPIADFLSNDLIKIDYRNSPGKNDLIRKIKNRSLPIGDVVVVKAGVKMYEKGKGDPPQSAETVRDKPFSVEGCCPGGWKPLYRGADIGRYTIKSPSEYVNYGPWLAAPRNAELFQGPKILMRRTDDRLMSSIEEGSAICVNSCHVIKIKPQFDGVYSYYFILGLLNSRLMQYYFELSNPQMIGKFFAEIKVVYVERLPLLRCEKQKQLRIEELTRRVLADKKRNADTSQLEADIDKHVYTLFDLTQREIQVVEESTAR